MTNTHDIPEWAAQMACDEANAVKRRSIWLNKDAYSGTYPVLTALARRIARTEKEPVDPDSEAAWLICLNHGYISKYCREHALAIEALKRGIEIGEGK